jgi:hypothetical protein
MYNETQYSVVDNALDEIRNVYPDVSHIFIFNDNGEIVGLSGNASRELTQKVISSFQNFHEKTKTLGGLDSLTITATDYQMRFNRIDNYILADVSSLDIDEKSLNVLSRVLIPTIVRLSNKPQSNPNSSRITLSNEDAEQPIITEEPPTQEVPLQESPTKEPTPVKYEQDKLLSSEPPANQLMVEDFHGFGYGFGNFKGLLANSDVALIERGLIGQWREFCRDKKIEEIIVEDTTNGKRIRLKFKPIQDSKYEGKGIVQLSEKTQEELQTKKGTLVLVRPIIEESVPKAQPVTQQQKKGEDEVIAKPEKSLNPSQYLPDLENSQFTIENLSGLGIFKNSPKVVRIDAGLIGLWREKYGDNEINEVIIQNQSKTQKLVCNYKAIEDSKYEGKQIVQMSEKTQAALEVKKGERVTIKPVLK